MTLHFNNVPQVTVAPIKRTDPNVADVVDSVTKTVSNFGYCTAEEFQYFIDENKIAAEPVLEVLRETGFAFLKTVVDDPQNPREIVVDLRPLAASMLLIYSDPQYALRHNVLRYVKLIYLNAAWNGGRETWGHHTLLDDMYSSFGHFFTNMKMAEVADLSEASEHVAVAQAKRHVHAINELVKDEEELTAVYLLTIHLTSALNLGHTFDAVRHHRFSSTHEMKAYPRFWRVANNIINNLRGPEKPKVNK